MTVEGLLSQKLLHVFYREEVSTTTIATAPVKNDIPSLFEHVIEETQNDVGLMCFLLEIHDKLEMSTVFGLIRRSCEGNINVFSSDPLIKVIFDLKGVLTPLGKS